MIRKHKNCKELQNDIDKIYEWSKIWQMEFNAKKMPCTGSKKENKRGQNIIPIEKEEKDLGVAIQENVSPKKHK